MTINKGLIAVCALVLLLAPLQAADKKDDADTSKEVAYATYSQKTGRVTVVMSSYLIGLGPDEEYLPVPIAVGAWGKGPELAIGIDAFLLVDGKGEMYSTATPEEIGNKKSLIRQTELTVKEHPLNTGNEFTNYQVIQSNMYTAEGVGDQYARVDRETYFTDVIWFPRPKDGLGGVMTLRMEVDGMEEPLDLRFKVPEIDEKKKKKG